MSAERLAPSPLPIRLLLIEDSQDDHQLVRDLLDDVADASFAIDWVKDLSTGRGLLDNGRFDVCLIDHQLPDGGGLDFIESTNVREARAPMIVLTGHGSIDLDRRAMAAGASGFLDKNRLDSTLLERTIRYAMRQHEILSRLRETALRDDTTGLVSAALFRDRFARALAVAKRDQTMVALVLIDLGHDHVSTDAQERLLAAQAKHLTCQLRKTDTIARLADHRFGLILEGLRHADDAALVAQKALDGLGSPTGGDDEHRAKPSAGIALYPDDCGDFDTMLRQAETAMRQAKTDPPPGYRFGCQRAHQKVKQRVLLSNDFEQAINQEALALRYRPLVHVTNKTISLTAEIYSNRPEIGPLSRDQFRSIAHDQPLIGALTDWLLDEAVSQLLIWQSQGLNGVSLSLPFISARPADLPLLEQSVRRHLGIAAIIPDQLEIDLDQKLVESDLDRGGRGLATLKATGIRLAVDEFGQSGTSFHKLAHDRLDGLKLSSRLYHDLPGNSASEALLKAIISLGHDLDLHVVANGARDERQFAFLRGVGCDAIKLCAAKSLLTADMFTAWRQQSKAPIRSEKAGLAAKSQGVSDERPFDPSVIEMETKESLSPSDSR